LNQFTLIFFETFTFSFFWNAGCRINKRLQCLCFDILDLEKQTIPIDNFNKPIVENRREHVTLKGIENTLNIW
jgi:hypothetical protein